MSLVADRAEPGTAPGVPLIRSIQLVAALAVVAAALGIGVRALQTAQVAVDEEQYLLSAISLAEDGDLDLADELREQRWRAFADVAPHGETSVLADGTQISPHDPLLPLLLAGPVALGGWVGAKVALSLVAGAVAALTLWLAVRRFGVRPRTATIGVAIAGTSMPLAVYGQQIYPELPAALAVLLAVLALTSPSFGCRTVEPTCGSEPTRTRMTAPRFRWKSGAGGWDLLELGAVVTVLPWLSVKYALVALVLAGLGAARFWRAGQRREVVALGVGLSVMGAVYLLVHRVVWGGWTAYASGEHFAQTGEFAVIGVDPDHLDRALRLIGLLLDREFGLVPWQPAWLLLVPAVAALVARSAGGARIGTARISSRVPRCGVLLWPLAAGWFVAAFVALTMHGYWWPGRQVVVVLPLGVLAVLVWLDRAGPAPRRVALGIGLAGVVGYAVFLVEGYLLLTTWVVHFVDAHHPVYRLLGPVLTQWRDGYRWPHLIGLATLVALAAWGVRSDRDRPAQPAG